MVIDKCIECPLRNDDNLSGGFCNIGGFNLYSYEDFPEKCPLLKRTITVSICENPKVDGKPYRQSEEIATKEEVE